MNILQETMHLIKFLRFSLNLYIISNKIVSLSNKHLLILNFTIMTKKTLFMAYLCLLVTTLSTHAQSSVILTQIYGGGGNSGATYRADFIELYNNTETPVEISNWRVYYASKNNKLAGDSIIIENDTWIPAHKHYLIQCKEGTKGTSIMADTHWESLNMAATGGQILIQRDGATPNFDFINRENENFIEYVAYSGSNTKSFQRKTENGIYCINTENILNFKRTNVCPAYIRTSTNIGLEINSEETTIDIYLLNGNLLKKQVLLSEVNLQEGYYIVREKDCAYVIRL